MLSSNDQSTDLKQKSQLFESLCYDEKIEFAKNQIQLLVITWWHGLKHEILAVLLHFCLKHMTKVIATLSIGANHLSSSLNLENQFSCKVNIASFTWLYWKYQQRQLNLIGNWRSREASKVDCKQVSHFELQNKFRTADLFSTSKHFSIRIASNLVVLLNIFTLFGQIF